MGKKVKKIINRFDGGMDTSSRATFEEKAELISHFDIYTDPHRLIPMPGYQEIVDTDEHNIDFRGLGGNASTLYGLGYARTDWIAPEWGYRVGLTEVTSGAPVVTTIDLSNMPAGFWANVNSDGSDIRVATQTSPGTVLAHYLVDFDSVGETGTLMIASPDDDIYIYYGNANAGAPTGDFGKLGVFNSFIAAYNFDVDDNGNWIDDSGNGYDYEHPDVVSSNYTVSTAAGYFGNALDDNHSSSNLAGIDTGEDFSYSFMFYQGNRSTSGSTTIGPSSGVYLELNDDSSGRIRVAYDYTTTSVTSAYSASGALASNNTWYLITVNVTASDDINVYVNGTNVISSVGSASKEFQHNITGYPSVTMGTGCKVDAWYISNSSITATDITATHTNYTNNASYWTVGSQVAESSSTPTYGGVALYENSTLTSGAWETVTISGQIMKNESYFPAIGQVQFNGSSGGTLVSQTDDMGGFLYGAVFNTALDTIFAPDNTLLSVLPSYLFLGDEAVDKIYYFVTGTGVTSLNGTTYTDDTYNPYSAIAVSAHNNYLAVGGHRRGKAVAELWDLASTDPQTFIDFGIGELRALASVGGKLFGFVNGFVDDSALAGGKPYFEIRYWLGQSEWRSLYKFESPTTYTPAEDWEKPVSQLKLDTNFGSIIYAKLPADATPTTYHEGFYAVGQNAVTGNYGVSQYLDTSSLGYVEFGHRIGNQYFFIHGKDGSLSRLAVDGTYDETSTFITSKLNDDENTKKKLSNVEIKTESLPSGQTYTVSVSVDGGAYQTVMTHDTDGEKQKSATQLADATPLPTGTEFQFKVTTTGGSAAMVQLAIEYEYYGV